MKYAIFFATLLATLPAAVVCSTSRRFLRWAVLLMFVPVIWYQSTAINFYSEEWYRGTARGMEISLIYVIAFLVVLASAIGGKLRSPFRYTGFLIYVLYFIWSALAFQNADVKMYSWFELWKMIMMAVVYLAAWCWLCQTGDTHTLIGAVGVVTVVNFLYVLYQHKIGWYQAPGFFMHQNSMAMFMLVIAPVFLAYYLVGPKSGRWWLYVFAFVCASGATMRTYSRGAMVALPISCMITATACFIANFRQRMVVRLMPLAVIGFIGFSLILPYMITRFLYAPKQSAQTRVDFANSAANMYHDKPWFGIGLNNWGLKINPPYHYNVNDWTGWTDEKGEPYRDGIVETIYLLVAAECGIPCLVILLLWFAYHWLRALLLCKHLAGTSQFFVPAGLLGGFTGIFLQSTLEWVLKQHVNFSTLMIYFAMIAYLDCNWKKIRREEKEKEKAARARAALLRKELR